MGQITSVFVRKVVAATDSSCDKPALLRSVGLDPDAPLEVSSMIAASEYYALLERICQVDKNPSTLPLRTGASMRCDDYGAFGLAWKSAPTLKASFERAVRYARVLTSVTKYQLETAPEGTYMHLLREGERTLGMRFSNEASIASIASISRQVSTEAFNPIAIHFKHSTSAAPKLHEDYFCCPVHFGSDRDVLLVSDETLLRPNKLGDESISQFFDTHLDAELSKYSEDQSLDAKLRIHISSTLSEGIPTISSVAQEFGLSGRTLQRRLATMGISFQTLVDESRRQLSEKLLRQTDYSLAEISFMTGFSEQSAFTRAFKRWAGQTPRSYRLNP